MLSFNDDITGDSVPVNVMGDGSFTADIEPHVVYRVVYIRPEVLDVVELERWHLSGFYTDGDVHHFHVVLLGGPGSETLEHVVERRVVERRHEPCPQDAGRSWYGIGPSLVTGEHFSADRGMSFSVLYGRTLTEGGIPWLRGFGRSADLDLAVRYGATQYSVQQRLNPDYMADVVFQSLTVSVGPSWVLRELQLESGGTLAIEGGLAASFSYGSVWDGGSVLSVDFGGEENSRSYHFPGIGVYATNAWWVERPGMDWGFLLAVDYVHYLADPIEDDGWAGVEDEWYGGMVGLSLSLVVR